MASSRTRPSSTGVFGEGEFADILQDREFGAAHAIADRARLPVGSFGADQAGQEGKISLRRLRPLPAISPKLARMPYSLSSWPLRLEDLMAFHQGATFLMLLS